MVIPLPSLSLSSKCCATLSLFTLLIPAAQADRVVTIDGRVIEVDRIRERPEGGYILEFANGTIEVPGHIKFKAVEMAWDPNEYKPKNDNERDKLAQGFVRFDGKWISKSAYKNMLRKASEASAKRATAMAAYSNWKTAPSKESKHFIVKSNTSPELLEYYSDLMESYYKLMDKRIGIKPTPSLRRAKMQVNIFKSRAEFSRLKKTPPGVAGYFSPLEQELNFYHDYQEPAITNWVSLHECTHLLTYLIDPQFRPQIWINEAVADFFGSSDIKIDKRGKISITPGKIQTDRVLTVQQALADDKAIALEDLFMIERSDFQAFEYAHAWSFVYFLNNFDDGVYSKKFARFFRELYTRKGVEYKSIPSYGKEGTGFQVQPEVIRSFLLKKLGVKDVALLESNWHNFIGDIEINAPEARLKRGLRAVQNRKVEEALPDLTAAIDAGLADARAYASRARALASIGMFLEEGEPAEEPDDGMTRSERMDLALEDIDKAIELDPLNASYRFDKGMLLLGFSPWIYIINFEHEGSDRDEARASVRLALNLAPDNEHYADVLESFDD
ncbi:MAG TPA: DUF1570 domain-containing protein [Planctomycetes bacterium]|nr:DUF1570 domain-containing protein [Planctomycetota bacterium]HIL37057.1 DUF1570 domain-containing protein [Planctomycetota bacterium]